MSTTQPKTKTPTKTAWKIANIEFRWYIEHHCPPAKANNIVTNITPFRANATEVNRLESDISNGDMKTKIKVDNIQILIAESKRTIPAKAATNAASKTSHVEFRANHRIRAFS